MRLATFEYKNKESWGIVLLNEADGREWVYEPEKCEAAFKRITNGTNGYFKCLPEFMPNGKWPKDIMRLLEMGDAAMERLRSFETFLKHYVKQSDSYYISCCGHPLEEVRLRVPIPRAALFLGLVQNSPSFFRADPARKHVNILPQGHQRSMTSVIGSGETYIGTPSGNVELAIVIGKECYNVTIDEAYDYIAGFTVVYDSQTLTYENNFDPSVGSCRAEVFAEYNDWFADATGSWLGKGADSHCVCGPYITTKDEVGNPYDLLVWTKTNGGIRDRSSTAGYAIGVERTVQFFSQFMTLHPGDIIHMGTVGTDGIAADIDLMPFDENGSVGAEIEYCGEVSAHVYWPEKFGDNRSKRQKEIPLVPTVQDFINIGIIEIDKFNAAGVQDVWTCYGNFKNVEEQFGWKKAPSPRMLNGPRGQITDQYGELVLSPIATELEISAEMALVIKKTAKHVNMDKASDYILGYAPVLSVTDLSIKQQIVEPATPQERSIGLVYGRWGNGYNTIGEVKAVDVHAISAVLCVEGVGEIEVSFDEYLLSPERIVEFLTMDTTLLPGDVIMLGRVSRVIRVPEEAYQNGLKVRMFTEGFNTIEKEIKKYKNTRA